MSSSYDSAVVDAAMIEDPRLSILPRGVRLLHIEATVWCKARRTDGFVPAGSLRRLTDEPDEDQAATMLVSAGIWETVEGGWQLLDYQKTQMTRVRVERRIASSKQARDDYELRNPNRPRRGKGRTDNSGEQSGEDSGDSTASLPSRPPAREGMVGSGSGDDGHDRPVAVPLSVEERADRVSKAVELITDPEVNPDAKRMAWKQLRVYDLESIEAAVEFVEAVRAQEAEEIQPDTVADRYLRAVGQ